MIRAFIITLGMIDQIYNLPKLDKILYRTNEKHIGLAIGTIIATFILLFPIWIPLVILFGIIGEILASIHIILYLMNDPRNIFRKT